MTQKEKELLIKDLCMRLPYGVKAYVKNWSKLDRKYYEGVYTVDSIHPSLNTILTCSDKFCVEVIVGYDDYEIKPYLFPLESMTEEQKKEYNRRKHNIQLVNEWGGIVEDGELFDSPESFEYLIENHFDCHGLIPIGLAEDATNLNVY
jgi:hypothetical protein